MAAALRLGFGRRLLPNVIELMGGNPGPMTLDGSRIYVLGTGPRRILVDTGEGKPEFTRDLAALLREEKCEISTVLLTHHHRDHVGGLEDVLSLCPAAASGVFKAPHSEAGVWWPASPHAEHCHALGGGDEFRVEGARVRTLLTPGHTSDSVSFALDLGEGGGPALFVGDCVLGAGTAVFTDLNAYEASLEALITLSPTYLFCGHGDAVTPASTLAEAELACRADESEGPALAKLRFYLEHRRRRVAQVSTVLSELASEASAMDISRVVYERAGMAEMLAKQPALALAAAHQTLMALEYLEARGRAVRADEADEAPLPDAEASEATSEGGTSRKSARDAVCVLWRPSQ
jgi:endoribonuclease LACTB2